MLQTSCLNRMSLTLAAQKLWNLLRPSSALLGRSKNISKSLKYVFLLRNLVYAFVCVGKVEVFMKMPLLQDFMALLAYQEPEKSPVFHLISLEYREQVADSLNRAILGRLP